MKNTGRPSLKNGKNSAGKRKRKSTAEGIRTNTGSKVTIICLYPKHTAAEEHKMAVENLARYIRVLAVAPIRAEDAPQDNKGKSPRNRSDPAFVTRLFQEYFLGALHYKKSRLYFKHTIVLLPDCLSVK